MLDHLNELCHKSVVAATAADTGLSAQLGGQELSGIGYGLGVDRTILALEASSSVMRTAMGNPLWWVGTLAEVVAYGLQIIALGF